MAWGDAEREGDKKCEKCGEEYTLYSHKWPARERGWAKCKCGEKLIEWNGSRGYSVRFKDGTAGESWEN